MLGITVGWGGVTSIELAYMVVLDLAAKMPLAAGVKFTSATAGVTLFDVVAYSVCPHKPTDFFCLPAEVGCPTMLEWNAFQCLCQYFSDGIIWSHLISFGSLPEVYSRVVLGALRTRPETTLSKTWSFADDMVSWFHGCEIYCNLLYKHITLRCMDKTKTVNPGPVKTWHAGWIVLTDRVFLCDLCSLEIERI